MVLKRSKLYAEDRANIGWESPEDWEYDNETLTEKIAKLKKKQYGEVDNPPSTPCNTTRNVLTSDPQNSSLNCHNG
jgi:hypothetical protein